MMSETAWVSGKGSTGGQRRSFLRGGAKRSVGDGDLTARSARGPRWRSPSADLKTDLRGGDVVELRRATRLALGVGVCAGEREASEVSVGTVPLGARNTNADLPLAAGNNRGAICVPAARQRHVLMTMMGDCMPCMVAEISRATRRLSFFRTFATPRV